MGYKNKTKFYRIPFMGSGDRMTQQDNTKQWAIVDNLLYASTFGCDKFLLQQGNYQLNELATSYELNITPAYEDGFSLMGVLNYRLFYSKSTITIKNIYKNKIYYVYLFPRDGIEYDPSDFYISIQQTKMIGEKNNFLLCIINTFNESKIITDINKVYAKNILAHTKDNTNPHGKIMYQHDLNISNSIKLKGEDITSSMYLSYFTQNEQHVINFPSNKEVLFVTAYPQNVEAGNIAWRIEDKKIILSNSGKQGIKVNLKLDIR